MRNKSPLAGKTVKIKANVPTYGGEEYLVEDWWLNITGSSWRVKAQAGNPACMQYAARSLNRLPQDDDVLYGKVGPFGILIHISEVDV